MIIMAQIVSIFCSPPPLVFLYHLFKSRTILILFFLDFFFVSDVFTKRIGAIYIPRFLMTSSISREIEKIVWQQEPFGCEN